MVNEHHVIVITDGDTIAADAVQAAASALNLHTISASIGHPTKLSGQEIANLVYQATTDPVIVFFDDRGDQAQGRGETSLLELVECENITVIGAVAVASEAKLAGGVRVDASVTSKGQIVNRAVDKHGIPVSKTNAKLKGDTIDVLTRLDIPVIIGLGDPGKQHHGDDISKGAPLTKKAIQEVLKRSQF